MVKKISKKQDSGSIAHILSSSGLSRGSTRWIPTTSARMTHFLEQGSIMLEVVAVLALMGVMGAMLFRQIYQRNQELHNIQMASEIRTVKEAFSAYIKANRASILNACDKPSGDEVKPCSSNSLDSLDSTCQQDAIVCNVKEYLPENWFTAPELAGAYTFTLWNYLQNDGTGRRVIYGIVVPTADTLPTTGWNFKRAARIALLIGADGGAYGPGITKDDRNNDIIAGALGSWQINTTDIRIPKKGSDKMPTYVATTGIDLFSPEYEMPKGDMKIPKDWSLALQNLHAYNGFSVGNKKGGDCYTINHTDYAVATDLSTNDMKGTVKNDGTPMDLTNTCQPLFWVGDASGAPDPSGGNVYVATDLNIGGIDATGTSHDSALKLTAEGVIKQKGGLAINPKGMILSSDWVNEDNGELLRGEHFVLDLARTSNMMDIRLASRGGARLSQILPNYILKTQELVDFGIGQTGCVASASTPDPDKNYCTRQVSLPSCPDGYKVAAMAIPMQYGLNTVENATNQTDVSSDTNHKHTITHRRLWMAFYDTLTNIDPKVEVSSYNGAGTSDKELIKGYAANQINFLVGYFDAAKKNISVIPENVQIAIQTYCVWEPSLYNGDKRRCEAAGYRCDTGTPCECKPGAGESAIGDRSTSVKMYKPICECLGFTWQGGDDNGDCHFRYVSPDEMTNRMQTPSCQNVYADQAVMDKAAICKTAGYVWDETNERCDCPSGTTYDGNYSYKCLSKVEPGTIEYYK